jgi:hypothetical protein
LSPRSMNSNKKREPGTAYDCESFIVSCLNWTFTSAELGSDDPKTKRQRSDLFQYAQRHDGN